MVTLSFLLPGGFVSGWSSNVLLASCFACWLTGLYMGGGGLGREVDRYLRLNLLLLVGRSLQGGPGGGNPMFAVG